MSLSFCNKFNQLCICRGLVFSIKRLSIIGLLVVFSGPAIAALPAVGVDGQPFPSLAPMLKKTSPSVVNIATFATQKVANPLFDDPFFRRFFNVPDSRRSVRRTKSAGSGVVVDARRGYIITNNHVIDRADEITVGLSDGRTLTAELVGKDPKVDLAVLKVAAKDLTELKFADSSRVAVGDFVVAIGNPFGLNQTVTSGIVSALGRSGLQQANFEDYIQTDASINPGNSGGALVDLGGNLVGINTAIYSAGGNGNIGIGFAIPAYMVRSIMKELIEHGRVRRGYVGLSVEPLNADLAKAFDVSQRDGVVVVDVQPGGAADSAGLMPGDIITRVGKKDVMQVSDYHSQTAVMVIGDRVQLELLRDGKSKRVTMRINDSSESFVDGGRIDPRFNGTRLQNFAEEGGDVDEGVGVLVTDVEESSTAWRYGLRPGDLITAANRRGVRNLGELGDSTNRGQTISLRVYRNGEHGIIQLR